MECGTSCSCDTGPARCCCFKSPDGPGLPTQPSAPSSTARDLLPPPQWGEYAVVGPGESADVDFVARFPESSPDARVEVRLTVLFCSIQI